MLQGFGLSVEYNRLLRVEAQIEASVLKRMEENGGLFLPPDIVKGRHVFFAIDNIDFTEDTYDGRNTLHGTAMAIYQKCHPDTRGHRFGKLEFFYKLICCVLFYVGAPPS